MIVKTQSKTNLKKLPMLLTAGALAAASLLDPVAVQAQSSSISQTRLAQSNAVTLVGAVTRDLPGNEFSFRADDGRTFRVVTRSGEPAWIAAGARLQMSGRRDGDLFVATSIKPLNTSRPGGNVGSGNATDRITLAGAVTQNLAGNQFLMRADDGRTFRVTTRNAEPAWVSAGDRIQVRGWRDGDLFVAENVHPLNNANNTSANQSDMLTLSGVVTQDLSGNDFYFRTDDNRTFRVRSRATEPSWIAAGNRVEVRGRRDARELDLLYAENLRLLSQRSASSTGQNKVGDRVDISGVVEQIHSRRRLDVRLPNGRSYAVATNSNLSTRVTRGDQVRVVGRSTGNMSMGFATVTLIADSSASNTGNQIDFSGVVAKVNSRQRLEVRGDNGRTYQVASASNLSSRVTPGDRVRIVGRSTGTSSVGAATVALLADNNTGNANATSVNFPGRVESVSNNGLIRNLRVRADNGQVYSVTYRNLQTFRVGDRVRVIGTVNNGIVSASSVTML